MATLAVVRAREALGTAERIQAGFADQPALAAEHARLQAARMAVVEALALARHAVLVSALSLALFSVLWLAAQLLFPLRLRPIFIPLAMVFLAGSAVGIWYASRRVPEQPPEQVAASTMAKESHRIAVLSLIATTISAVIGALQLIVSILD